MQFQMQRRILFQISIRIMFQDAINHVPTDFQLSVFKFKLLTALCARRHWRLRRHWGLRRHRGDVSTQRLGV